VEFRSDENWLLVPLCPEIEGTASRLNNRGYVLPSRSLVKTALVFHLVQKSKRRHVTRRSDGFANASDVINVVPIREGPSNGVRASKTVTSVTRDTLILAPKQSSGHAHTRMDRSCWARDSHGTLDMGSRSCRA
jgi:hypothetical protein